MAEAAEAQVRRVGAERDRAVAALVDAGGRGSTAAPDARAVAEAVAAAQAEHDARIQRLERDHAAQLRAAEARAADREASRAAEAERTARRERERADRPSGPTPTRSSSCAAERERAQLAKAAAARKKPATSTKSPLRPRTARSPAQRSPAARSPATPTKAFQALVAGGAENRDARRALVAKGRDEYHALRRANGDLRSQRDGLVDEVASLKKELAQTRLVLHGMEYYAAGHQHQTMAL